jgi:hypothetical protein
MMRNEGVMQLIVQGMERFEVKEWLTENNRPESTRRDIAVAAPGR